MEDINTQSPRSLLASKYKLGQLDKIVSHLYKLGLIYGRIRKAGSFEFKDPALSFVNTNGWSLILIPLEHMFQL